ncbi:MAG: hypothetical protein M1820_002969 [Bogoriella megaspora]|nr:MAG: hypothetical protein M1820_002969 [Bogoriella megaspora]
MPYPKAAAHVLEDMQASLCERLESYDAVFIETQRSEGMGCERVQEKRTQARMSIGGKPLELVVPAPVLGYAAEDPTANDRTD